MPHSAPHTGSSPRPRVLLVDDHVDSAELLRMLLERRGFSVKVAGTVAGALEAAEATPFDVLVSDIELPDGKGHDLVRRLRASGATAGEAPSDRRMPAIALSGLDSAADVQSGRDAGFDEYLGKPVSVDDLVAALRRVSAT